MLLGLDVLSALKAQSFSVVQPGDLSQQFPWEVKAQTVQPQWFSSTANDHIE